METSKSVPESLHKAKEKKQFPAPSQPVPQAEVASVAKKKKKKSAAPSGTFEPVKAQETGHIETAQKIGAFELPFIKNYIPVQEYMKRRQEVLESGVQKEMQPGQAQKFEAPALGSPAPLPQSTAVPMHIQERFALYERQINELKGREKARERDYNKLVQDRQSALDAEYRARSLLTQYAPLEAENTRLRQKLQELERRSGQVEPESPMPVPPVASSSAFKEPEGIESEYGYRGTDESGAFGSEEAKETQQSTSFSYAGLAVSILTFIKLLFTSLGRYSDSRRYDESGAQLFPEVEVESERPEERPLPKSVSTTTPSDPLYEVNKLRTRISELERVEAERLSMLEENKMLRSQLEEFKTKQSSFGVAPSQSDDAYKQLKEKYKKKKATAKDLKKQLKESSKSSSEAYENLENDNKKLRERIDELEARLALAPESSENQAKIERLSGRIEELESVRAQSEKLAEQNDILKRQIEQLQSGSSSTLQS